MKTFGAILTAIGVLAGFLAVPILAGIFLPVAIAVLVGGLWGGAYAAIVTLAVLS